MSESSERARPRRRVTPPPQPPPARRALIRSLYRFFVHLYFRVDYVGREHVPADGPAVLIGNHPSYVDPYTTAYGVERWVTWMAWDDAFSWPVVGRLISAMGAFPVNLERPLTLSSRLGGHLVQGHVDGVGEVTAIDATVEGGAWLTARAPDTVRRYLVEKGSVCVDGVSLTVAALGGDSFSVALIPHTLEVTTLGRLAPGRRVNLEADVLGKYVKRYVDRILAARQD